MNKLCPMIGCKPPCYKEKCAWYLVHSKQCAVPLIASNIKGFHEMLQQIAKQPIQVTRQVTPDDRVTG